MAKSGRNSRCPCGSGLKYKQCCGLSPSASNRQKRRRGIAISARQFAARVQAKSTARIRQFGHGREIISAECQGSRFVAVGSRLFNSTHWKTFLDFLFDYPLLLFGTDWGREQLRRSEDERHVILRWYSQICEYQKLQAPGRDGIYRMVPDGVTFSYFALAYDLYCLQHNLRLQDRVVQRLKHDDQFQGARYELIVAATLVRAGCDLDFEDESDGLTTHPEFVARHRGTNSSFDVEAKSRQRSGVLGRDGEQKDAVQLKLGIHRELNRAAKKFRNRSLIVFVDANMPPEQFAPEDNSWSKEVQSEVARSVATAGGMSPFSLVVVSNFADHYLKFGDTEAARLSLVLEPRGAVKHPIPNRQVVQDIEQSLSQYGNIPNFFPDRGPRIA